MWVITIARRNTLIDTPDVIVLGPYRDWGKANRIADYVRRGKSRVIHDKPEAYHIRVTKTRSYNPAI